MNDWSEIKEILLNRRDELEKRLDKLDADIKHKQGPLSQDFAEQVVEQENADVLHTLNAETRSEFNQVISALGRIEAGTYGQCIECGEVIPIARLKIVPFTQHCLNCKAAESEH